MKEFRKLITVMSFRAIIIIIIIIICFFLYTERLKLYETNNISRVYNVAALPWLQYMAHVMLFVMFIVL
jgi:amino acid permease